MIRGKQKMGERGGGGGDVIELVCQKCSSAEGLSHLKDQVSRFAAGHLDLSVW